MPSANCRHCSVATSRRSRRSGGKYKPGYERYLHAESVTEDVDDEQQEVPEPEPAGDTSPSKVEEASL